MTGLDPRSPLVLDVSELGRRPGSMQQLALTVAAPADLGNEVIRVPAGSELQLTIRLESVMEGVLVSAVTTGQATGECVRCLDTLTEPVRVTFQELFVYPERKTHREEIGDDQDEEYQVSDDHIDLEPVLRDAVVLALPFQPVCSPDCPGLCSECGARLADDPEHHHDSVDPRWAALTQLVNKNDE